MSSFKKPIFVLLLMTLLPCFSSAQEFTNSDLAELPTAIAMVHQGQLEIKIGSTLYQIEDPGAGTKERSMYETLSDKDRTAFNSNRKMFLSLAARALGLMKYGFGIGSILKDKISFQLQQSRDRRQLQEMRNAPEGVLADFLSARDRAIEEQEALKQSAVKLTLKQRSQQIVQSFLKGIDQKLWQQAPLFARSNEFGMMAAGGVEILGGGRSKGWGGAIDLGISIGYNRDDRSLAVQIYSDFEKYKSSAMPALFLAGAFGKFGTYVANQRAGELEHDGISYYPPMMPAFSSVTQDNFMTGFSSGLTWPPSPIGDMLTYTDSLSQNVLLRVTISPMTKGFVRIYTGLGVRTIKAVVTTVNEAIQKLIPGYSKGLCSAILVIN